MVSNVPRSLRSVRRSAVGTCAPIYMMNAMATSFESAPARALSRRKTILLLSGTSEGPALASTLAQAGFRVIATVTRQEACAHLFRDVPQDVSVAARGFT